MTNQDTNFYRAVFLSLADLVVVTNTDWTVTDVNPALSNLLGYTREEVLGTDIRALFNDPDTNALFQLFQQTGSSAEPQRAKSIETRLKRKNSSTFAGEVCLQNLGDGTQGVVLIVRDITERKRVEEDFMRGALYDALTGLPNKGLFHDRVHRLFALTRRAENRAFAVVFLDLDRFKYINDSYGHEVGDQALVATARRIEACMRPGDTVARLGGDEFGVVIDDIKDASEAAHVVNRIIKDIEAPLHLNNLDVTVTASAGIAVTSYTYDNPDDLIRNADMAMYRAKNEGRDRCEIFDDAMRERTRQRMDLESDLRLALERRELRVYYHPIISLSDMKIIGAEALVRWEHPTRGLVSAGQFVPLAEEIGLIIPIGEWILREVLAHQKAWSHRLSVALNISQVQFENREFVESFTRTLREEQADSNLIRIDVTEKTLMKDIDYTINVLNALNALGIQILIDDFGTGSSSLGYLKRFPVSALKIDRSFISEIPDDIDFAKIVKAAIIMAHTLGLNISAEGVENEAQIEFLKIFECDEAQGYFFSKPMPAVEFSALIETAPHMFRQL